MAHPSWPRTLLWSTAAALLSSGVAWAAESGGASGREHVEALFIAQIASLILVGRLLGELMRRIGQPSVMGELIGGLLLGPSVLGLVWPEAQHALFPDNPVQKGMLGAVASFGILLLLLITGMETDLKLIRRVGTAAFSVSLAGIFLPFLCGFALGQVMPATLLPHPEHRLIASLFLGTALSISSVKIVAVVVREMNFMRRNLGQVILSSAIVDDTIGWIIIAITFSLASHGSIDLLAVAQAMLGVAIFLLASLTIGRRVVSISIRWTNDNIMSDAAVVSVILLLMIGMALTTQLIGVHTVLGAFVAGILVGESPILTRQIDQQLRGLITGLFAPVFFGVAGLSADLSILKDPSYILLTLGLILIASIGKAAGAFVGGKLGGLSVRESIALACAMNARGSTEVIVATIGLSMGALSHDMFTMIVAMAVITTMAMPPTLRWALARVPLRDEEKARLEREEFEARSFVHRIERILLAVDESANGRFAARLAGFLAGSRGMAATVLHVGARAERQAGKAAKTGSPEDHLKVAARRGAELEAHKGDKQSDDIDIVTRAREATLDEAIAQEAGKGYDLLVIGLRETTTAKGDFTGRVSRAAAAFDGPLVLVSGQGEHLEDPQDSALRILVPITGTDVSRRAAEIAIVIGRAVNATAAALHIAGRGGTGKASRQRSEKMIVQDFSDLAARYGAEAAVTTTRSDAPADTILHQERDGRFNLIVLGVNRRPGESLYFGEVAAAVAEKSRASILFVSGPRGPADEKSQPSADA